MTTYVGIDIAQTHWITATDARWRRPDDRKLENATAAISELIGGVNTTARQTCESTATWSPG